ncbi:MAG: hypothetical protein IKL52_00380 [Candidatus Gastranaerophilales bacterium]|nr:hypothetical protein [Candidatus Gastranaerophilales bacterium]
MLKNYFIELGNILKFSALFFAKNFKKENLIIWLLILFQLILAIPLLYFQKALGFGNYTLLWKILSVIGMGAFAVLFFFMFKKVFKLASLSVQKEKLSNTKIIKSLVILGILNCIPFLAFLLFYSLAQFVPTLGYFFKISLNIFTYLFYFAMSLSIAAIAKWQDKNIFVAILKSVKLFFKKIGVVIPIFFLFFLIASLIVFLICALLYTIAIYFNYISENLVNAIHAVVNVYSLYIIAGLYIGAQAKILESCNE